MAIIRTKLESGKYLNVSEGEPNTLNIKGVDGDRYEDNDTGYNYVYDKAYSTANPTKRSYWVNLSVNRTRSLVSNGTLLKYDDILDLAGKNLKAPLSKFLLPLYHIINSSFTGVITFTGNEKLKYNGVLYSSFSIGKNESIDLVYLNGFWFVSGIIIGLESNSNPGSLYHLQSGDSIIVEDRYEYFIACNLILDLGSRIEIENGGRLVVHSGAILNDGVLTNNGIIKIGL
jgi:hypothetical protein